MYVVSKLTSNTISILSNIVSNEPLSSGVLNSPWKIVKAPIYENFTLDFQKWNDLLACILYFVYIHLLCCQNNNLWDSLGFNPMNIICVLRISAFRTKRITNDLLIFFNCAIIIYSQYGLSIQHLNYYSNN